MKKFPINIGFDDSKFEFKSSHKNTSLIGVVCQGIRMVDVIKKEITIDGDDATTVLISIVKQKEKHIQYIFTDSITFAGFNIINLEQIFKHTGKPIIAITEKLVDLDAVKTALIKNFPNDYKIKFKHIIKAGNLYETELETAGGSSKIFFHCKGIDSDKVKSLLRKVCIDSKVPESVRLAHLIGKAF
ncbi:MAG: DUF99 family protein [Candidatus Thorarchaeota archaeon]